MANDENGAPGGDLSLEPHQHTIEPAELDDEPISRCVLDELPYTGGSLEVPTRDTSLAA